MTDTYSNIKDAYLKERIQDIRDIGRRILDNLLDYKQDSLPNDESEIIIITEELTASQLMDINNEKINGFVTEKGGATSHTAILARSLGIPLISGVKNLSRKFKQGSTILINGFNGEITRNPLQEEIDKTKKQFPSFIITEAERNELEKLPSETADGTKIELYSNVRSNSELKYLKSFQAEGIGLYRTEMAFLDRKTFPSEEEQFSVYKTTVETIVPHTVTFRTIDLGGDKFSPFFPFDKSVELNPYLGLRAIRVSLSNPKLFKIQLRAILRASAFGKVKLMLPLISNIEEIKQSKRILAKTMLELKKEKKLFDQNLELGVMIEIPSAVIMINAILNEVDFISVGTNDLIQYTLAVDRGNEMVSSYYEAANPAILSWLKHIVEVANRTGKEVSICGEMAADLQYTKLLIGMGYRNLSMIPFYIPQVKKAIRCIEIEAAKDFAYQVLKLTEIKKIKNLLMNDLMCG